MVSLMPDRDWPPLQRRLARLIRTLAYALGAVGGGAILTDPPTPGGGIDPAWAVVLAAVALAAGSIAAMGAAWHNWHVEWVAVWFLSTAFSGYGLLAGVAGDWATAAALQFGGLLGLARAVDLWVFSLTASHARAARVRSWRRTAGLDG